MLGLLLAAFALVACDGDDNGDDLGLNGDTNGGTTNDGTGSNGGLDATATPGTGGGGTGAGGTLEIEMIDIDYSQDQIDATAGEELTIDFENTGALEHTFTITEIDADVSGDFQTDEYDIDVVLNAGESATLSFTPNEAGTYEFWCTVAGHREAGMVGTLTVTE